MLSNRSAASVISSSPQRWQQGKFETSQFIQDYLARGQRPVCKSVYDLVALITACCTDLLYAIRFAGNLRILDLYNASILRVVSSQIHQAPIEILKSGKTKEKLKLEDAYRMYQQGTKESLHYSFSMSDKKESLKTINFFFDTFKELDLLGEIEGIKSELEILTLLLDGQTKVTNELATLAFKKKQVPNESVQDVLERRYNSGPDAIEKSSREISRMETLIKRTEAQVHETNHPCSKVSYS